VAFALHQDIAQPDHTEKLTIWQVLDVERRAGIVLTESSRASWQQRQRSLFRPSGREMLRRRQDRTRSVHDARRKGLSIAETERWLQPILNYDADRESQPISRNEDSHEGRLLLYPPQGVRGR
jgi:5-methyltetrahydrofolate--homocysteine methyltransferase